MTEEAVKLNIENISELDLELLRREKWEETLDNGSFVKNSFMQELVKKSVEEINSNLEFLTAVRRQLNLLENKGKIPPEKYRKILQNPDLFNEITITEYNKKIVGEYEARKVIFLSSNGRLVENCQTASYNLLINDESGIGKDYVAHSCLSILSNNVYIHKTKISATVFNYWHDSKSEPSWTWNGKVFYCEDISENVLNSDVFKVMSSSGSSATITIKQQAVEISINGKPVNIITSASATPNFELIRRYPILNLDSSINQTREIMKRHSEYKKKGLTPEYNQLYTEALDFLKRVKVKIPFADLIDPYFPANNIMMRTHYPRFLDYVSASTAFHQFQRKQDTEGFILAEDKDYDIARICFLKLCSNKYMIPLTINQKSILKIFEENPGLKGSVSNLHGTKMNFVSDNALQTNLRILVRYGILETNIEKDTWNRDMEVYSLSKSYQPQDNLKLPTYEEIINDVIIKEEKVNQKEVEKIEKVDEVDKVPKVPNWVIDEKPVEIIKIPAKPLIPFPLTIINKEVQNE